MFAYLSQNAKLGIFTCSLNPDDKLDQDVEQSSNEGQSPISRHLLGHLVHYEKQEDHFGQKLAKVHLLLDAAVVPDLRP